MNAIEFRQYAIEAFRPLTERYGLQAASAALGHEHEFRVTFSNATTVVIVDGINWGFGINVRLASSTPRHMKFPSYDFDDLLTIRAPDARPVAASPNDTKEIQKQQIDWYVRALDVHASDVLQGDFASFPSLAGAIEARLGRRGLPGCKFW